MVYVIGIPIIVVVIIGFPLAIFLKLFTLRKRMAEREIQMAYGLFYIGLND